MNAAARALEQSIVLTTTQSSVSRLAISKQSILTFTLLIFTVLSALAVITIADLNRITFGQLASLEQTRDSLQTTYGQLLLEENTWSSPDRVENIAGQTLGMTQPDQKKVVIIRS